MESVPRVPRNAARACAAFQCDGRRTHCTVKERGMLGGAMLAAAGIA